MPSLSPWILANEPYPFEALDRRVATARREGREVIDLGVGDPQGETPAFIRRALVDSIEPSSSYPRAAGLPELRAAIAGWSERRFGVTLDPDLNVIPTLGSKEPVFALARSVLDPDAGRDLVLVTSPGYTIPERGAKFAGGEVRRLPLAPDREFLPDLDAVAARDWDRAAVLWLNYPNNPTGAVAPRSFLREAVERCREHDVWLAADEAYVEQWFDEPAASVLELDDLTGVIACHTLSKRSHMTGYRSGFLAGDPVMIEALRRLRPSVGVTPQEFVQRASVVAWNDDEHAEAHRRMYERRRRILAEVFARHGVEVVGSRATFYLWVRVPGGRSSLDWALELLDRGGIVVAPGSFFGPEGEGFVRMATVPSDRDHERAAAILDELLVEAHA